MKSHRSRVQRLTAQAKYPKLMPVYGRDYRVHLGPGPVYDTPYADDRARPVVIYWFGHDDIDDYLHEVGHAANTTFCPEPRDCEVFKHLIGGPDRSWYWDRPAMEESNEPDPYCEGFADLFSLAQLHRTAVGIRGFDIPATIYTRPVPVIRFRRALRAIIEARGG